MAWKGVIVHHSACPDSPSLESDNIKDWHLSLHWLDVGYHFLIEQVEGGFWMLAGRPLNMIGAHAFGYNSTHLGVCFVGNFSLAAPSPELLKYGAYQIKGLLSALNIPLIVPFYPHGTGPSVLGHREVNQTECPGKLFDMDAFRALLT